jgi:hypothetical protein
MRFTIVVLCVFLCQYASADIYDVAKSVCRIEASYVDQSEEAGVGIKVSTGFVYKHVENKTHIMCAGHSLDKKDIINIAVEFFYPEETAPFKAEIVRFKHNEKKDYGIIEIDKVDRPALQLGSHKNHKSILTYGCPNGEYPTMFLGTIRSSNKNRFRIYPSVKGGRSGSPVCDIKATIVIGMVIWKNGTCITSDEILDYISEDVKEEQMPEEDLDVPI